MNILSLFGGIETGRLIAERLGWKVNNYFSSEIDSYPIMATKKNWPEVVHVGSVTETFYQNGELHYYDGKGFQRSKGYINLLLAGSPCQDLSIAKNDGKGLEGDRSKLFYEFVRLLLETRPEHFFLENVASMKAIWRDEMTKVIGEALYGTCIGKSPNYDTSKQKKLYNYYPLKFQHPSGWITEFGPWMLNAGMVSAQNRKRLYWTDIKFSLSDVQELASQYDSSPKLKDILEDISFDALDAKGNPIWKPLDEKYLKTLKQNENCMYELNSVGSLRQGYEMFKEDGKTYGISSSHAPNTQVVVQIPEATSKGYCEPVPGNVVDMTQPESSTPRGRLMTDKANTCMTGQNMMLIGEVNGGGQGNRIYSTDGKSATLSAQCGGAAGASSNLICGQFRRTDLRIHADQEKICTLTSNMGTGGNNVPILIGNTNPCGHGMNGCVYDVEGKSPTLTTNKGEGTKIGVAIKDKSLSLGATYAGACPRDYFDKSNRQIVYGCAHRTRNGEKIPECNNIEKSNSLTTVQSDSEIMTYSTVQYVWRKLTVTECCRLQGLPDNYLSMLSNARAYKAAGNGWQADMVEWMLKFAKF